MKKEVKCNCLMCTKTSMKQGEVYKCIKETDLTKGAIFGVCEPNTSNIPLIAIQKVFIDYYDNEKNN